MMYRAIFVDDVGYPTCSLCYFTEKRAIDDLMGRRTYKKMVEEHRYVSADRDLTIIILKEVFEKGDVDE